MPSGRTLRAPCPCLGVWLPGPRLPGAIRWPWPGLTPGPGEPLSAEALALAPPELQCPLPCIWVPGHRWCWARPRCRSTSQPGLGPSPGRSQICIITVDRCSDLSSQLNMVAIPRSFLFPRGLHNFNHNLTSSHRHLSMCCCRVQFSSIFFSLFMRKEEWKRCKHSSSYDWSALYEFPVINFNHCLIKGIQISYENQYCICWKTERKQAVIKHLCQL